MTTSTRFPARRTVPAVGIALAALTGCTGTTEPGPARTGGTSTTPTGTQVTTQDVATGLDVPWGIDALPDGRLVVTERGGTLVVVDPGDGSVDEVGGEGASALADGTRAEGEAGLLGVALSPVFADDGAVYLYRTGEDGNAVLRASLDVSGDPTLTDLEVVLDGIPKAGNHDGGRLAFGPDGDLYVTAGDAAEPTRAQDPGTPGGKILRITTDGQPAPGNPTDGSPVWSLGHRNPQGLGWAPDGTMIAAEFGQSTWDELNVIEPGANYGWPEVEGIGDGTATAADGTTFTDPVVQWSTSDASPSGLVVTADAVYVAALRGERLWRVPVADADDGTPGVAFGEPEPLLVEALGRLRAVVQDPADPSGATLLVLTNNTDGRGTPRDGDDRLVRVEVAVATS